MKNRLFLLVILVISVAVAASVLFYNQKQLEMEKVRSLRDKIQAITTERIMVVKRIKETKEEKQRLQDELDKEEGKVQQLQADISETRQKKEVLLGQLLKKESAISKLEDRLNLVMRQESELNTKLGEAKSDYQDVVEKMEAARKEKIALEEKIKARIPGPKGVELKKIVVRLSPSLEGEILEVNKEYNFAVIDLGIKDNIKSGDLFGIYREGQLIAEATADNIYEDMSSIRLLGQWLGAPILNGDTVKLLKS